MKNYARVRSSSQVPRQETHMSLQEHSKLASIYGCLTNLRARQSNARRRFFEDIFEGWLCLSRSPYAIDADQKLLPSKAVCRLEDKTQVVTRTRFSAHPNRHIRSRGRHTSDVENVATMITSLLGLNDDLARAIAIGHDMGHVPFGHLGETFLTQMTGREFRHEVFGAVIAQKIERNGAGLNLTKQVLEGILHHSRGLGDLRIETGISEEANAVMYADKIAYVFSDINDLFFASRFGLRLECFPLLEFRLGWFGEKQRDRVQKCVEALCLESAEEGHVSFAKSETAERFAELKKLMYKVYPLANYKPRYGDDSLVRVYDFLGKTIEGVDPAVVFALLCDSEAIYLSEKEVLKAEDIDDLTIAEIIPHLQGRGIGFTDPDLDW